jgi:hypothetical protein
MFAVNVMLGLLTILSIFIYENYAATCSSYSSQSACQQSSVCAWKNSVCACNASAPLEVVFVMDASGSVTSTGWTQEINFVISMVDTGLSPTASVGVVEFATATTTPYDFNKDQTRSVIDNTVKNLKYMNKDTYTLNAMMTAFKVFYKTTKHKERMIMLITDGSPNPPDSQNPCDTSGTYPNATAIRHNLTAWNITTILVTVGPKVKASTLGCLYNYDSTRVISASGFDATSFQAIRSKTDSYLCPTNTDFRMSEVRAQVSASGDDGGNARFIELYNNGDFYDFVSNPMILKGYVKGTINSGTGIAKGKYLVIYDNSNSDMQCSGCTCTGLSSGRCSQAVYIGCGSGGSSCSFNTSMSNSFWYQKVTDTIDSQTWINVKHDSSSTSTTLASVYQGFTFEVLNVLGDVSTGRNWQRSCTKWGTPGDKPLSSCSATCAVEICQASGDSSASCSSNKCTCTASNHYYSAGLQCNYLPPPTNCVTQVLKERATGYQYGQVVWDDVGIPTSHHFEVTYTYDSPTTVVTADGSGITNVVYGGGSGYVTGHTLPTVRTALTANSQTVYSTSVSCSFETQSPSAQPTRTPTSNPTHRPTAAPSKRPTKKPTKPPTKPPTAPPTKRPTTRPTSYPTVSGYHINTCSIDLARGSGSITVTFDLSKATTVSDSNLDLSLQLNLDGDQSVNGAYQLDGNTSPQTKTVTDFSGHTIWLWPRYKNRIGGSYVGYDRGHACTVVTQSPTPSPTRVPSHEPTHRPTSIPTTPPTRKPTGHPTPKPTYRTVVVPQCDVTLGRRSSDGKIKSFDISFTEPTLDSQTIATENLIYDISWASTTKQVGSAGSDATQDVIIDEIEITWDDIVTMTPIDSSTQNAVGSSTTCTKHTLAPSVSPTPAPHAPTQSPITPNIGLNTDSCTAGTVDARGNTVYVCSYKVSQGAYDVNVDLLTPSAGYSVDFTWDIIFDKTEVEPAFDLGQNVIASADDLNQVLGGSGSISAGESSGRLSIYVVAKSDESAPAEVAWLELTSCSFQSSTCNVNAAKSVFRIEITDDRGAKQTTTNNKGKMPLWVWYPIAAGILILAGLAAFGYMYYNKRKLAEEQLQQREADLANVEELDNMENFGGLGDNINFNPIATAGTQDIATGGEYIDKQLAKQQKHTEFAQVDVDKEVWRQDFGQVKADRHTEV